MRRAARRIVTLLTDFGTADGYVGAMKGVLATLAPDARIVDISHDIRHGDLRGGALALEAAAPFFPRGTVHVAVVDPGVGTARRALAVASAGQWFVGPDNGVLTLAARAVDRALVLDRARYHRPEASATFHGRDVFAPVAARLARGIAAARLGSLARDLVELELPVARVAAHRVVGEVIHADRFGNLITNIARDDLSRFGSDAAADRVRVEVGRRKIPGGLAHTYGDARPGALLALIGSGGRLEVARRDGSAAALLGYRAGTSLVVRCVSGNRR
jgi:S-adenosylmethionine hydrolase